MAHSKFTALKEWYETHERAISVGSLFTGFVIDSLTMKNIDALQENLWMGGNLFLVALSIYLLNKKGKKGLSEAEAESSTWKHFWLPNILQFSTGALLGSIFIFYFRSTTLLVTWPYLLMLLLAMIANELFQKRYAKLAFQLSFFYFALFSFAIFGFPLLIRSIGPLIFLMSGVLSLMVLWFFVAILKKAARERFLEDRTNLWGIISLIFLSVNILYFTNLIPPIPLSLKDSGIYHSISRLESGNYEVKGEPEDWKNFLQVSKEVHWVRGTPLYVYAAIYSPGSLNTEIAHEWQYKNEEGDWVTATRIPLYLSGGRSGGFRTYTSKYNLTPGDWRVNIETPRGQVIGRVSFEVIESKLMPATVTLIKE